MDLSNLLHGSGAYELTLIISSLAGAIVSIINAIKNQGIKRVIDDTQNTVTETKPTIDLIHKNTNGEKERLQGQLQLRDMEIKLLNQRIELLEAKLGGRRDTDHV